MEGKGEEAGVLLRRADFTSVTREDVGKVEPLFSATLYLGDPDLTLFIAREWVRLHVKHGSGSYMVQAVLQKCRNALDAEAYRNLCLSLTDQVLQKPKESAEFLTLLPALQKDMEEPLITEEQVMDLLDEYSDGGWGFGLGPVVLLLPAQNRGAAMRTIWGKVNETYRGMFLMMLVGEAGEELGEGATDFVLAEFPETLNESNESSYYVQQLVAAKHNQELVLAMLDAMVERDPQALAARGARATILLRRGDVTAALAEAAELYKTLVDVPEGDWQTDGVRRELLQRFLPDHLATFLAVLDELEAQGGKTVERYQTRFDLLGQAGLGEEQLALMAEAVEAFPEEETFLMQRRGQLLAAGQRAEAMELLERMIELDPKQRQVLLGYWKSIQNPIQALAVKQQLMAEADGGAAAAPGAVGEDAASSLIPLSAMGGFAILSTAGSSSSAGGASDDRPSMEKVKEAVGAEDWQLARTQFRRMWREFPKGEQDDRMMMYFGGWSGARSLYWPADEEEASEEQQPEPSRGGLSSWREAPPERASAPRSAFDALAEFEFGVDEMQRLLRSKDERELDQQREVFKGLLRAKILASGEAATLAELVQAVAEGRAGKLETTMLLTLLDEHPELQDESTAGVLAELARAVRATDVGPLRALARVQARQGNTSEAQRLYTWLATRAEGSGFYSFDDSPSISQRELLDDVRENLAGDERMAVIDAVIRFADPGDYPWARENFERLVLETYMELLEPSQAFERSQAVLEEATNFSEGMRRSVAKLAAVLYAETGDLERALECLEYGICALDASVVEGDARYWNDPTRPGWWNDVELRQLFPQDGSKFSAYSEWLSAAGAALRGWRAEERVSDPQALKALVIIALRLHSVGETAEALDLLHGLAAEEELGRHYSLWVVDALRLCGDEGLADTLERDLLIDGTLQLERLHEVVRRELERAGPGAAIALGGPQTEFVLNERLLDVLVEAATAEGDPEALARWSGLRDQALAAKTQLEALEEQERMEAEAAKAEAGL
jgi:tetratricopeptide (TPR) repeat protein